MPSSLWPISVVDSIVICSLILQFGFWYHCHCVDDILHLMLSCSTFDWYSMKYSYSFLRLWPLQFWPISVDVTVPLLFYYSFDVGAVSFSLMSDDDTVESLFITIYSHLVFLPFIVHCCCYSDLTYCITILRADTRRRLMGVLLRWRAGRLLVRDEVTVHLHLTQWWCSLWHFWLPLNGDLTRLSWYDVVSLFISLTSISLSSWRKANLFNAGWNVACNLGWWLREVRGWLKLCF